MISIKDSIFGSIILLVGVLPGLLSYKESNSSKFSVSNSLIFFDISVDSRAFFAVRYWRFDMYKFDAKM